ncbi:MAG: non-heme iron oxygenase ferredoxin subunit [Candidatus Latescibacterota bacterium]|nr:MAG: non-heme iron oxygenase ferredoxin subunit [Candidatus Latescibacterota bacterium]
MKAKVCKTNEIGVNTMKSFDIEGEPILVANVGGKYYSIADTCSHAMAYLSEGELLEDCRVQCPDHAAIFDLKTGEALALPAVSAVETFEVIVEGDDIFVETGAG